MDTKELKTEIKEIQRKIEFLIHYAQELLNKHSMKLSGVDLDYFEIKSESKTLKQYKVEIKISI